MRYIEAPNMPVINGDIYDVCSFYSKSIFLAGSITGAENWQLKAAEKLIHHYNVFNPRRKNYDVMDPALEEQITWEFKQLRECRNILFWFSWETNAPITLFEYSKELMRNKNLFIGIHPDYKRKNDVLIQTKLERPDLAKSIVFSLDELIEMAKSNA